MKKDQLLAELSIPELEQEWKQKKALVRQAESEVVQAEKALIAAGAGVVVSKEAVAEAEAGVDRSQAVVERWQLEVSRVSRLVTGGVDTSQMQDETQLQLRAAGAARKEATARVSSARASILKAEADQGKAVADLEASKARLEVSKAEVGRVEALREYTRIKAPFDGIVTHRAVNTGTYVTGGDKIALFSVARIDPVRVVVQVSEADAGLVTTGQKVQVTLQAVPGPVTGGTVTRTSWSLEPRSRTLRTEIDLPNERGLVRPGMYVYAKLAAELPAAWAVPAAAIGKVNEEPVVYLVESGKAIRVVVQVGRGDGQVTQVRRYKRSGSTEWSDISGSESIATPASALTDGQTISKEK